MNIEEMRKVFFDYLNVTEPQTIEEDKKLLAKFTPINGEVVCGSPVSTWTDVDLAVEDAEEAFKLWRVVPAPLRGEFIRILGDLLRRDKEIIAKMVTIESGKIISEGRGEVQEMIDVCDFAVGLSRQLYGLTMPSERPDHRLMETWHPLGVVGCITAFNFPVAVWAWNFAISTVCGNTMVWKPSEKTPLVAKACTKLVNEAAEIWETNTNQHCPKILSLVIGNSVIGEAIIQNPRVKLVSATGSTPMGQRVANVVAKRMGRYLLELGGNNAMIVTPSADLDLAVKAIVFSAVGTCGQRCTTLRRVIAHKSIKRKLVNKIRKAYKTLRIGDPLDEGTLVGPMIDQQSVTYMQNALTIAKFPGVSIYGGDVINTSGFYVNPAIVVIKNGQPQIMKCETFAPILYVTGYTDLEEAIEMQNDVPQGLSSSIFSNDVRETELFLRDSDCGIANVNIGTSGAEIGGAFGGEKETGGGRESGSDSWKQYMRRATNTINYGTDMPLAQGVKFD